MISPVSVILLDAEVWGIRDRLGSSDTAVSTWVETKPCISSKVGPGVGAGGRDAMALAMLLLIIPCISEGVGPGVGTGGMAAMASPILPWRRESISARVGLGVGEGRDAS